MWDVLWGGASPLAAFLLRDGTINSPNGVAIYCGIAFLTSLLVFQWFQTSSPIFRFYSIRDAFELVKACVLIAALSAVAAFLITRLEEAPRSIPILHFMLLTSGLLTIRILVRLRETRRNSRRPNTVKKAENVLLIQASRLAWFFTKMVEELSPGGYQIVAILDEQPKLKHRSLNGYPIIGLPTDLEKVIADYAAHGVHIDNVVVATQPDELSEVSWNEITRVCYTHHIGLEVLPEQLISHRGEPDEEIAIIPVVSESSGVPESNYNMSLDRPFWKIKRGIDLTVGLTTIVLLSPIFIVVFGLALLDVGIPAIFWQQRVGRNGIPLRLYKFRTLKTLYDRQTKERREAQDPSAIGRFLRMSRLDELPQLWNVFFGEMSLVGPRPLLPVDQPNGSTFRLAVRPGVTGWAQICGGTLISPEEKNALDEWYIRHASFRLDLVILLRTVGMLLFGDRRNEKAISMALLDSSHGEPADLPNSIVSQAQSEIKNESSGLNNRIEAVSP